MIEFEIIIPIKEISLKELREQYPPKEIEPHGDTLLTELSGGKFKVVEE